MKHTSLFMAAILGATLFFACSKKDNNTTGPQAPELNSMEKVLVGSWQVQSGIKKDTSSYGTSATYDLLGSCQLDDVFTFSNDKTYIVSDGSNTCSPNYGYNRAIDWKIGTEDSSLNGFISFTLPFDQYPKVAQLDNTTLKLEYRTSTNIAGVYWQSSEYTYTFQRK